MIPICRGDYTAASLTANTGQVSGNVNTDTLQVDGYSLGSDSTIFSVPNGIDAAFYNLSTSSDTAIEGNLTLQGGLYLGSWNNGTLVWNGTANFADFGSNTYIAASLAANWSWQKNGIGTNANQMTLNSNGNLTLIDSISGNNIAIVPANSSLVVNWFNGSSNGTEVISLAALTFNHNSFSGGSTGGNLTLGLGDIVLAASNTNPSGQAIYLGAGNISSWGYAIEFKDNSTSHAITIGSPPLALGDFLTVGTASVSVNSSGVSISARTIGNGTASGSTDFTMGNGATSSNLSSVALVGNSSALGSSSVAIGNNSVAMANLAIALGGGNATGNSSVAIGIGTSAQTWSGVTVGHYNSPISGNFTAWQSADPAFIVGVGNSTTPANGMVVYNSGNVTFGGNLAMDNPAYVSPTNTTQPQELLTKGATTVNGTATFNGNTTLSLQVQNGEISMGTFAH